MAKFCTNCGKPLKEGKTCTCKTETTREIKTEIKGKINDIKANPAVKRVLELAKGLFTKPIDAIENFSKEKNMVLGISFIAVSSILIALFITIFMNKQVSSILGFMSFGGLGGIGGFPFFKIFLTTTVGVLIISFAIPFLFYLLIGKVFKGNSSWKTMLPCCGAVSLFISMMMLTSIMALFISIQLTLIILLIGSFYASILLINSIKELTNIDKNKYTYTYIIVMTIVFIITWLLSMILL